MDINCPKCKKTLKLINSNTYNYEENQHELYLHCKKCKSIYLKIIKE